MIKGNYFKQLLLFAFAYFFEMWIAHVYSDVSIRFIDDPFFWTALIQALVLITMIVVLILIVKPNFRLNYFKNNKLLKTVGMLFLGLVFTFGFNIFYSMLIPSQYLESSNQQLIELVFRFEPFLMGFTTVVLAPILEELMYRYLLINKKSRNMQIITLILSSLIFGLVHISDSLFLGNYIELLTLPIYSTIGLALGFIYLKTERISYSILLHSTYNLIVVLLMIYGK